MEASLRALALEELALHPFPGISFDRLCTILQQENEYELDVFLRAVLWRSLYRCPDVYFTSVSSCSSSNQQQRHPVPAAASLEAAASPPAAEAAAKCSKRQLLAWRDPAVPPDLPVAAAAAGDRVGRGTCAAAGAGTTATAAAAAADACIEQQRQWLLTTSPGLPVLLLTEVDAAADKNDIKRRATEVPFQILRNIAAHKENGQWQYCLAQELHLDPKSVFHHLKPLYRDELICHMQLAIPPTHKLGRGAPHARSKGAPDLAQGAEASGASADQGDPLGGHSGGPTGTTISRGSVRTNLTVSALLWSSAFFSPLRLPAQLRGLVALQHLLPLQQQALRLLHNAPNNILLEEEVRQFCISKLLTSEEAPYLRFSDKQLRRLFYRLRESLERGGQVQRVRAFCRQTARFEPCLLLSAAAAPPSSAAAAAAAPSAAPAVQLQEYRGQTGGSSLIAQVKVEEGTVERAARAADLRREASGPAAVVAEDADGEDPPSAPVDLEGVSLASLASLLLVAAGSEGLTTVGLSRLLGLDIKRSGKALAEFSRRNLVSRVAERRGKCFLYRYISKGLPRLQALLAEAPTEDLLPSRAETERAAVQGGDPAASAAAVAAAAARSGGDDEGISGAASASAAPVTPQGTATAYAAAEEGEQPAAAAAVLAATAAAAAAAASPEQTPQECTEDLVPGASQRRHSGRGEAAAHSTLVNGLESGTGAKSTRKRPQSAQGAPPGAPKRRGCYRRGIMNGGDTEEEKETTPSAAAGDSSAAAAYTEAAIPPSAAAPAAPAADAAAPPVAAAGGAAASPEPSRTPAAAGGAAGDGESVSVPAAASDGVGRCLLGGVVGGTSGIPPAAAGAGSLEDLLKEMSRRAAEAKLPHKTQRLLQTPQFVLRLALFQQAVHDAGCCTIPSISKTIADAEKTPNGPDRKTIHRMADIAIQLEPRIRRGRVAASKNAAERVDGPSGGSQASADITFFYWAETLDEETAEQRVSALITQRRAHGCREAIRRNQLLLEGKLKEAGEELRLTGSSAASLGASQQPPSLVASACSPTSPPLQAVSGDVPEEQRHSNEGAEGPQGQSLVGKQLKGLEKEISRLAQLESRTASSRVTQPGPPATAASLLMVDKTLPRSTFQDKFVFSQKHLAFYGFIFPVMIRAKCFHQFLLVLSLQLLGPSTNSLVSRREAPPLTVSTMVRRMPLETFLRLIGCGYALPLLDEHLAREAASRHPMQMLPGPLFRLLVFSSRQLQAYRQMHPKAQLPLLGLGKKNAGTAVRKLLSLLGRMGIVSQIQAQSSESPTSKGPPAAHAWRLNEVIRLPVFSRTASKEGEEGSPSPAAREFEGLSHEGVEAYWQQLQLQVSQWVQEERQMTWAMSTDPQPSHFFSPHSEDSEGAQQSDREGSQTNAKTPEEATASNRWRVPLPDAFAVREAFNSKNWKGQVAFTAAARAALDAFAAETLERLRDAGGAELEALILNASSPQIVELSARIGYPADAVLRYLIRVFEIKGGSRSNQTLLIGGSFWEGEERVQGGEESPNGAPGPPGPPAQLLASQLATTGADAVASSSSSGLSSTNSPHPPWLAGTPTKAETAERDRGPGLLVHRTRDVRFQCHRCGHFYSWEKSLRLHYERAHHEPLPDNELLYVLPWERKRRLEDQQQKAELSKFRRRRRTIAAAADRESSMEPQQQRQQQQQQDQLLLLSPPSEEALRARERFAGRLLVRGAVKAVDVPASSFLLRATREEEAVLSSMGREDEIALIGAAVVAERLWVAAYSPHHKSGGPEGLLGKEENRSGGPLAEAWLFPSSSQSLPPEEHLIWQILGGLCMPPLTPSSARLFLGFVLSRRSLNSRIFSSFRRLDAAALRHFVLEGRIPSALELRLHSVYRAEGAAAVRKSLVSRPLSCPRVLMARNMLKAVVLTPLPFYRPAVQLAALRELRPLELTGLWRAWQRRGWVTVFKPPAAAAAAAGSGSGAAAALPSREKKEMAVTEAAGRQQHLYKRPEIATALEAKCRRPFVLSSSARLSLFGRLWDYRTLSALLSSALELTPRSVEGPPEGPPEGLPETIAVDGLDREGALQERSPPTPAGCSNVHGVPHPWKDSGGDDPPHELLLAELGVEEGQQLEETEGGNACTETNDGDLQLLQLLENSRLQQPSALECLAIPELLEPGVSSSGECGERQGNSMKEDTTVAVVGRTKLSLTSEVAGCEALAALEGLARGRLWLSPFWGKEGRLPDSTEAAADAELLKLLEDEDALEGGAEGEGLWNNVPEWLSALSLGRGEEGGDLLGDSRPMRRPTEGGIETHITAHAAGVPEITAITCSVLGPPLPRRQRKTKALEGGEASFCNNANPKEATGASDRQVDAPGSAPEIGGLCGELRRAFDRHCCCPPATAWAPIVEGGGGPRVQALGVHEHAGGDDSRAAAMRKAAEVEVPPASHLADGLFGAAGELDAFDPSLLPPVLSDRTASAATSFGFGEATRQQRETETETETEMETEGETDPKASAALRQWRFKPGLPSGFPVSLPTYADDYRQNWRFAARAVEAFAPPGCLCSAACGGLHEPKAITDNPSYTSAAPLAAICSPVAPNAAFAKDRPLDQGATDAAREERQGEEGPLSILSYYLQGFAEAPAAKECSNSSSSSCCSELPVSLLQVLQKTACVALRVQRQAVLPLLPTPPQPQAARRVEEVTQQELASSATVIAAAAAGGSIPAAALQRGKETHADVVVCVSLAVCPAWLLSRVLAAKADGVAVPVLLLDLAGETETAAAAAEAAATDEHNMAQTGSGPGYPSASCRGDTPFGGLQAVACLSFKLAASKLALRGSGGETIWSPLHPQAEQKRGGRLPTPMIAGEHLGSCCEDCWVAACGSQLFLVCVALLCYLRLVVPVPAGDSWRLVAAAEAAPRFCLKEQQVVRDPLAARWASHNKCCLPVSAIEERRPQAEAADSQLVAVDVAGDKQKEGEPSLEQGNTKQTNRRPGMVPRAIWTAWGPSEVRSQQQQQQQHHQQQKPLEGEVNLALHGTTATANGAVCVSSPLTAASSFAGSSEEESLKAFRAHADVAISFFSALLTWEENPSGLGSSLGTQQIERGPLSSAAPRAPFKPMRLASEWLPACAWVRLDGRLHASLVQLLCLRLWMLLTQRPGSTAQQLQGMLCLLDDCEVQFLLHALVEEGVITASLLWGPSAAATCGNAGRARSGGAPNRTCLDTVGAEDNERALPTHAAKHSGGPKRADCCRSGTRGLSMAKHILNVQAIYLPNTAAEVLPKFQPLLLPRLARCSCGCSVLL